MADLPSFLADWRLQKLLSVIADNGGEGRVAGGAVRDWLLGRKVGDIDVATTLEPDAVTAAMEASGFAVYPTGIDHGTVTVNADGLIVEVTTLRSDVSTDGRRAVVRFSSDWREDAERRDFTVNALYLDQTGKVHDPTGIGLADIKARRLSFVGDPGRRIVEDYLRILRFFRFGAELHGFTLSSEGLTAVEKHRAGLEKISGERITAELFRLLVADNAAEMVALMGDVGVLAEIVDMTGDVARLRDVIGFEAGLEPSPIRRLFALTSQPGRLVLSRHQREQLDFLATAGDLDGEDSETGIKQLAYKIGKGRFVDYALVRWLLADKAGRKRWTRWCQHVQSMTLPVFPLKGRDLVKAGVSPGPALGAMLGRLEAAWIKSDFSLSKAELITQIEADGMGET